MIRAGLVLCAALSVAGCDLAMKQQDKPGAQSSAQLWSGGPPRQPPPEGTIAEGDIARAAALTTPPPLTPQLTPALLDRGEERYTIYCSVCHGIAGNGDGRVVQRGFPAPPDFHIARLVAAPPGYFVAVITNGHGVMYSYADRVSPADRWAIAAYVKALQRVARDTGQAQ